ncbi:hypothetical protein ABLL29_004575 [Salmonella enterica subsp. enterica]
MTTNEKLRRISALERQHRKDDQPALNPNKIILVGIEPETLIEVSHDVLWERSQRRSN